MKKHCPPWSAAEDAAVLVESAKPPSERRYDRLPGRTRRAITQRIYNLRHRLRPSDLPGAGNGTQPKTPAPSWTAAEVAALRVEMAKPPSARRLDGLVPGRTLAAVRTRMTILRHGRRASGTVCASLRQANS